MANGNNAYLRIDKHTGIYNIDATLDDYDFADGSDYAELIGDYCPSSDRTYLMMIIYHNNQITYALGGWLWGNISKDNESILNTFGEFYDHHFDQTLDID